MIEDDFLRMPMRCELWSATWIRIIVAHRPETILQADRVLKLDGGKLQPVISHVEAFPVA